MTRANPVVSIELLLDAETERAVRADWQRLADAGLSSMAAHTSASNRPHLTLLVRDALPEHAFSDVLTLLPIAVELGAPILFPHGERGVLVRPVLPTPALIAVHAAVHASVPPGADAPHTAPGEWMPHVTLARRLRVSQFGAASSLLGPPVAGRAVGLRRWDAATRTVTALG